MNWRFGLKLALRETRRSRLSLAFSILSVALGVAALTAIQTITSSLQQGLVAEGRQIFGADLAVTARQPLKMPVVDKLSAELIASGARAANSTVFNSMLVKVDTAPSTKRTTLVRVRAVDTGYPFYGTVSTQPPGAWQELGSRPSVILDPTVARELGASPGTLIKLGSLELEVLAVFEKTAGGLTAEFSFAPLAFIHERYVAQTGLLQTGSRVDYERYFAVPKGKAASDYKERYWDEASDARITLRTFEESAANVQRFWSRLTRFLLVVGLVVLLLGALGIASSLRLLMRQKADHAAIWRCLGATPGDVLFIYACFACLIAFSGSVLGGVFGVGAPWLLQDFLTRLGAGYLPAHLQLSPNYTAFSVSVVAGVASTLCFTTLPLIDIASTPPLLVLRRATSTLRRVPTARTLIASAASVVGLLLVVASQVRSLSIALMFAAAVGGALCVLLLVASAARRTAHWIGRRLPWYALRQGIANLHRPDNQARSGMAAIGLGVMLLTLLQILGYSLETSLRVETQHELPNLFLVDVLPDQAREVRQLIDASGATQLDLQPMISGRLRAVNGQAIDVEHVERHAGRRDWNDQLRTREYFFTYRDAPVSSELIVDGQFWQGVPQETEASVDEGLAQTLNIALGDRITLDIAGLPLDAKVTSVRRIRWQALRLNTLVVLSPGEIEQAPRVYMGSLRLLSAESRYALQTALVTRFPNVSVIDVNEAAGTAMTLLRRVADIFRIVGLMALIAGAVIVASAVAAGRTAREREAMLFKVLGATPRQLRVMLTTEYLTLATLGALSGWLLAEGGARILLPAYFETVVQVPYGQVAITVLGAIALNGLTALWLSRHVAKSRPLALLREV